ncbi:MAG: hypothetical protein P4M00_25820 [Azospirillaceae bacterium]|nr:hypothetical protein [Azospirillaceae bacterium]
MMMTTTLHGHEAVEYAEKQGLLLNKHADPIEDARHDITPQEAYSIIAVSPALIWIEAQA